MDKEQLKVVLEKHKKWILDDEGGVRADLSGADLSGAYLSKANLRCADLSNADLSNANLRCADLSNANLRCADLSGAYLRGAELRSADLRGADLRGADLRGADLRGATGNGEEVKTFQFSAYQVVLTKDKAYVGCQTHSIEKWLAFDEEQIREMDREKEVTFYKNILKPMLVLHINGEL